MKPAGPKIQRMGRDRWNDSYYPTGADAAAVNKPWYIIDAEGQTLGRLAVLASHYVRCVSSVYCVQTSLHLEHNLPSLI
jgi:hypothetical protein